MRKLRVGVWINDDFRPEAGGAFGYYDRLVKKINEFHFAKAEITFLTNSERVFDLRKVYNIKWRPEKETLLVRFFNLIAPRIILKGIEKAQRNKRSLHEQQLKKELFQQVDLIYYLTPGCVFPNFPFIYTLWDLGHLSMYAFPEVNMNQVYELRKLHHDTVPFKALMVFTESQAGKSQATKYLGLDEKKMKCIPMFPSQVTEESFLAVKPTQIDETQFFIFYPAQYWPHKNHYNLLHALKAVLVEYPHLQLVLTGSDKGNKNYVDKLIEEFGLTSSVKSLGFVSSEEIKWLYLHAKALVMPTFLGPTNMPLLEAAELKCPVICSDLEGHREQLGEYGYYFNPENADEMATKIIDCIKDKENGNLPPYKSTFNIANAMIAMDQAFTEIRNIRFCWGENDHIF